MALDDILSAIRHDAKAEAAAIRRDAGERTKAIESEARTRAEELAATIANQAERRTTEAARAVSRDAERQLRATRLAAERERSRAVFDALEAELGGLRADPPRHRAITTHLVKQALAALPEATSLKLDPRDHSLVQSVVGDRPLALEPSLATWGGVVVSTRDGSRRIDNTLEARLRARREDLLLLAAQALGAEALAAQALGAEAVGRAPG